MNRKNAGIVFALCLGAAATVRADDSDDARKSCIATWTTACSKDCAGAKCVSNCTTQAHNKCRTNLVAPQLVFNGPVSAVPTSQCPPLDGRLVCAPPVQITVDDTVVSVVGATCSLVSGTVANRNYFGGNVTVWVICPAGTPVGSGSQATTSTIVGQGQSSCADGKFSFAATNQCGGVQTGCYGLIAATPPSSCETCGTCDAVQPPPGDPGWNTCTSDVCPTP